MSIATERVKTAKYVTVFVLNEERVKTAKYVTVFVLNEERVKTAKYVTVFVLNEETFLQDFLEILKQMLQNFEKILGEITLY